MSERLGRWGVGPQIAVVTLAYAAVAWAATHRWPGVCHVGILPRAVFMTLGGLLLILGFTMLMVADHSIMSAYQKDQLRTSGVAGRVRHPIYSSWIVFILPGIALISQSWPLFLMPFVAYAVFKLRIHHEDEYLQQRYGDAYLAYRAHVNELIPDLRFWRQSR